MLAFVDTIITDSSGNSRRYDSAQHLHDASVNSTSSSSSSSSRSSPSLNTGHERKDKGQQAPSGRNPPLPSCHLLTPTPRDLSVEWRLSSKDRANKAKSYGDYRKERSNNHRPTTTTTTTITTKTSNNNNNNRSNNNNNCNNSSTAGMTAYRDNGNPSPTASPTRRRSPLPGSLSSPPSSRRDKSTQLKIGGSSSRRGSGGGLPSPSFGEKRQRRRPKSTGMDNNRFAFPPSTDLTDSDNIVVIADNNNYNINNDMSREGAEENTSSSPSPSPSPTTMTLLTPELSSMTSRPSRGLHQHHHIRASSFREPKTSYRQDSNARDGQATDDGTGTCSSSGAGGGAEGTGGIMSQTRRNSMPNVNNLLHVPGAGGSVGSPGSSRSGQDSPKDNGSGSTRIRRVRSFKTTSKGGIVNRGDSFKKKSTHSLMSTGSTVTEMDPRARCNSGNNNNNANSCNNGGPMTTDISYGGNGPDGGGGLAGNGPPAPAYFRVNIMGAEGVGKTSMTRQFMTSEAVDHDDSDESHQMTVTVLLDGEESTIEFIDSPNGTVISEGLEQLLDAHVVVFAINDHDSFVTAQQLVRYLRVDYGTDRAILLVANKTDLVRKRKVTADEARLVATTYDCKYAETSAALNHYVDELLVGVISQIRLQLSIPFTTIFFPHKDASRRKDKKALCKGPKGFFSKLFRRAGGSNHGGKRDRRVDNLLF